MQNTRVFEHKVTFLTSTGAPTGSTRRSAPAQLDGALSKPRCAGRPSPGARCSSIECFGIRRSGAAAGETRWPAAEINTPAGATVWDGGSQNSARARGTPEQRVTPSGRCFSSGTRTRWLSSELEHWRTVRMNSPILALLKKTH